MKESQNKFLFHGFLDTNASLILIHLLSLDQCSFSQTMTQTKGNSFFDVTFAA